MLAYQTVVTLSWTRAAERRVTLPKRGDSLMRYGAARLSLDDR
jgi:hypothetical protein